jgi:hypothetical protein
VLGIVTLYYQRITGIGKELGYISQISSVKFKNTEELDTIHIKNEDKCSIKADTEIKTTRVKKKILATRGKDGDQLLPILHSS